MSFIRTLATIAFSVSLVLPTQAGAQVSDYPNRKLTFIVGFAPGGGIDTIARVLAQGLTEQFGYQIVIENRPGAASNIAARAVANATPDGYTYLVTGNSLAINQTYYKNPGYTTSELDAGRVCRPRQHGDRRPCRESSSSAHSRASGNPGHSSIRLGPRFRGESRSSLGAHDPRGRNHARVASGSRAS